MRVTSAITGFLVLLFTQPAFAQDWVEYTSRVDRFAVPAPDAPNVDAIAWESEYGATFPARVYAWQ